MPSPPVSDTRIGAALDAGFDPAPADGSWECAPLYARSGLDSLGMVAGFVRAVCLRGEVGRDAALRLRLAVEELIANTVAHGYGEGREGRLILAGGGDGRGSVSVQLRDGAPPFDPSAAPGSLPAGLPIGQRPVGGLGIPLALASADAYRYEYVNGQNRSTLTVWRHPDER